MKALAGIALALAASTAMAQEAVTFTQYKVSTEVAADLARQCRVEVQLEYGERCERFYSHMENHMALYNNFTQKVDSEGDKAYGSADAVELELHQGTVSRLMENMRYINTMAELHAQ